MAPFGVSNPVTGAMAAPRLVSAANGTARVGVLGLGPDGAVVALDSIVETVRQVARRVAVEPLRANITSGTRSRSSRWLATLAVRSFPHHQRLSNEHRVERHLGRAELALTPTLRQSHQRSAESALPASQSGCAAGPRPHRRVANHHPPAAARVVAERRRCRRSVWSCSIRSSQPAFNKWLRFGSPYTAAPDSVQADGSGAINTVWTPRDSAGTYTLTGVRGAATALNTVADSAGRMPSAARCAGSGGHSELAQVVDVDERRVDRGERDGVDHHSCQ